MGREMLVSPPSPRTYTATPPSPWHESNETTQEHHAIMQFSNLWSEHEPNRWYSSLLCKFGWREYTGGGECTINVGHKMNISEIIRNGSPESAHTRKIESTLLSRRVANSHDHQLNQSNRAIRNCIQPLCVGECVCVAQVRRLIASKSIRSTQDCCCIEFTVRVAQATSGAHDWGRNVRSCRQSNLFYVLACSVSHFTCDVIKKIPFRYRKNRTIKEMLFSTISWNAIREREDRAKCAPSTCKAKKTERFVAWNQIINLFRLDWIEWGCIIVSQPSTPHRSLRY